MSGAEWLCLVTSIEPLENGAWRKFASLAAAEFLRYANHSKLTRFGVLDDLRRH
jgi:hypothetical protein